jgi:DNA-binding transcriptional ArsR family regulator
MAAPAKTTKSPSKTSHKGHDHHGHDGHDHRGHEHPAAKPSLFSRLFGKR